jgi:hypothetical protein
MGYGQQTDGSQTDETTSAIFWICFTAGVEKMDSEADGLSVSPITNV